MIVRRWIGIVLIACLCGVTGNAALAKKGKNKTKRSDRNVTIDITYGVVRSVEEVKLKSNAASGAAVGGIAGVAVASGGTKKNLEGAAAGAALGALIAQLASKHKAQSYDIRRPDGSEIRVIVDHSDAAAGDCVAIEEGRHTNIRRVEPTMCSDGEHHADAEIRQSARSEAVECHMAKQQLLDASTQEEVDRAASKIKILCH